MADTWADRPFIRYTRKEGLGAWLGVGLLQFGVSGSAPSSDPSAASLARDRREMITAARLGIDGRLAKTLTTWQPHRAMICIRQDNQRPSAANPWESGGRVKLTSTP
jgi:hypothetical protein